MISRQKLLFFSALVLMFLFSAWTLPTLAIESGKIPGGQGLVAPPQDQIDEGMNNPDLRAQVLTIVNYFLAFLGLICVIAVIYFGFLMVIAGGDEKQYEKGRKGILYLGLGIIIILLSYAIVSFFVNATNTIASAATPSKLGFNANQEYPEREEAEYELQRRLEDIYVDLDNGNIGSDAVSPLFGAFLRVFDGLPPSETADALIYQFRDGVLKKKRENVEELFRGLEAFVNNKDAGDMSRNQKNMLLVAFKELAKGMENLPRMRVSIRAEPNKGNAPLLVSFSGLESTDPGRITIPKDNYRWSYIDNNGHWQDIGSGGTKVHLFPEAGAYVMQLRVVSLDKKILPGIRSTRVVVSPPKTQADFTINGDKVFNTYNISMNDAKNGIEFNPAPSIAAEGKSIVEYQWRFDEKIQTTQTPDSQFYIFSTAGEHKATLRIKDSFGSFSEKTVILSADQSIAIIKIRGKVLRTGEKVVFDGTSSSVEDSQDYRYLWQLTGPTGFQQQNFEGASFEYMFLEPGEYQVDLTVGVGFKDRERFVIKPQPPTAVFMATAKGVSEPATIRFDAGNSSGPNGSTLGYSWDFDNDGKFEVQGTTKPVVYYVFKEAGDYDVKLAVTDSFGETSEATKKIQVTSVLNVGLVADNLASQPNKAIILRANAPGAARFDWDFGDGVTQENGPAVVTHAFREKGRYNVSVTAFGTNGDKNTATINLVIGDGVSPVPLLKVLVDGEDVRPEKDLCGAGKDGIALFREKLLELSAADSVGTDGSRNNLTFVWDFHDGTVQDGVTASRKYSEPSAPGSCEKVTFSVQDGTSGASTPSGNVYIFVKNATPSLSQLVLAPAKTPCDTPCQVTMTATGVHDPDGTVAQYRWWAYREGDQEKVDFHETKNPQTIITIPARGSENEKNTYYFVVELVDNNGGKVISEQLLGKSTMVLVQNQQNPTPEVDFSSDRPYVNVGETVTLTASAKDPSGEAVPLSAYAWDFNDDGTYDDTYSGPTVSHVFSEPGDHSVRLRVTVRGVSASKKQVIRVAAKAELPLASFFFTRNGLAVAFDGRDSRIDSNIPDNTPSFSWDFDTKTDTDGNGQADDDADAIGAIVDYRYEAQGMYNVQLNVSDSQGKTARYRRDIDLREKAAPPEVEIPLPVVRTPRLSANIPIAALEILARKNISGSDNGFDIIAYGTDLDGAALSGSVEFRIIAGEGEFTEQDESFTGGYATAHFHATNADSSVTIEVATKTLLGDILERVRLLPQILFTPSS